MSEGHLVLAWVACIFWFTLTGTVITGKVPHGRHIYLRKHENPKAYWTEVALIATIALACLRRC